VVPLLAWIPRTPHVFVEFGPERTARRILSAGKRSINILQFDEP
jgi:hypothetical protein